MINENHGLKRSRLQRGVNIMRHTKSTVQYNSLSMIPLKRKKSSYNAAMALVPKDALYRGYTVYTYLFGYGKILFLPYFKRMY